MFSDLEIVLIEESESDAEIVLRALKRAQIHVSVTHLDDGELAFSFLDRINSKKSPPVLILLDLKMPKIDGLDLIRRIKTNERLRSIPLVVLSSSREDKDIRKAYELGINSYVVKTVDYETFSKLVVDTVNYWLRVNQPPV